MTRHACSKARAARASRLRPLDMLITSSQKGGSACASNAESKDQALMNERPDEYFSIVETLRLTRLASKVSVCSWDNKCF
mmetsp:Transcript_36434/g.123334  ORF Transcript_36434/g.123334 Transcript_36434/m.123334 type:complete len:80 (+) Transcript_36434:1118-1357(+)